MRTREKHTAEQGLRPISPGRAFLLKFFGPAESWDNPLTGTRYDPLVKQHRDEARRARRQVRRSTRRQAREAQHLPHANETSEHYTPDE